MSVVSGAPVRLHGLDALRAAMTLLGLVLHAGVGFTAQPSPVWPYHRSTFGPGARPSPC